MTCKILSNLSNRRKTILLRFAGLSAAVITATNCLAQQPSNTIPLPQDWSSRHLIFSKPANTSESLRLQQEPRYWYQMLGRKAAADQSAYSTAVSDSLSKVKPKLRRDWGMSLLAGGKTAAGMFPAKFSFDINASPDCLADYVAYPTGLAGSSSEPNIIAYDELYSTQGSTGGFCSQNGPSVKWSYNTGTGTVLTSPVLSGDGTKVAYVETSSGSHAILRILKWKPGSTATVDGTLTSPATPATTLTAGQSWSANCPPANSCAIGITFSGTPTDTNSSPYYDYTNDVIYVGDNNGVLHKFTGVFNGAPAEDTTSPWPITVHSASVLTGPVFDSNTKNIFVGDASGRLSYVRETGSTTGTCSSGSPPCLGSTTQTLSTGPIADAPLVDSVTARVFAFSGVTSATISYEVLQTDEALTTSQNKSITFTGASGRTYTSNARAGAFDNLYYGTVQNGHLYVCAPDTTGSYYNGAALYEIGFNSSGIMNTTTSNSLTMVSASPASGTAADECSPISEIYNGTTDYLFVDATINGSLTGCTGSATIGCLYNFNVTSSFPSNASAGLAVSGGTSGIVADNIYLVTQAWVASHAYSLGTLILDSNSNVEKCTTAGTSKSGSHPSWNATVGGTTSDGTVTWTNLGANQTSSIYFTYLNNGVSGSACNGTSSIGCAVKATQALLQ